MLVRHTDSETNRWFQHYRSPMMNTMSPDFMSCSCKQETVTMTYTFTTVFNHIVTFS